MIWQFTGVGPQNKGAELMFLAMREQVLRIDPDAQIAMLPGSATSFEWRCAHGLLQVFDPAQSGRLGWLRDAFFRSSYRERFGIVHQREVDVVLDASGFAFGDQWKAEWIEVSAAYYERLRRQGTKVILLPQALGPFRNPEVGKASRRVIESADLVFARDSESAEHARQLSPSAKVREAPDFTNLLKGRLPSTWVADADRHVAIVPNRQMLEKGDQGNRENYTAMMAAAMRRLREEGCSPFVLLHEINDRALGENIASAAGLPDAVKEFSDPLVLKGILGNCRYSLGSRFHGLVNCLSQGVPAVGTSWSHKYRHLYRDYDVEELLVEDLHGVERCIPQLSDEASRRELADRIGLQADSLRAKTKAMWGMVFDELSLMQAPTDAGDNNRVVHPHVVDGLVS